MPPGTPLQRDAIVAAARDLIAAGGLDSLSLRRLATKLGVTAPALYAHVEDKRDLLRAVAEVELGELVERYAETADEAPIARIRAHAHAYVGYSRRNPELFSVLFLFPPELSASDLPEEVQLPAATRAFGSAAEAVADAIAEGSIVTDDPLLVTLTLWAGAHGVATVLGLGFGLPAELEDAMVDEMVDRLLAGYAPR
jgi:AcrR family transcriptional regulator